MTSRTLHPTALRVVRAIEDGSTAGALPWNAELAATYGTRDELLVALHEHWSRQLLSRIDSALEVGSDSPAASVAVAWRSALRDQPHVHRLLEAEAANPALAPARRTLHASVAVAAGLATFDDPVLASAALGERYLASVVEPPAAGRGPSWVARTLRRLWDGGPTPDPFPWSA